MEICKVCKTPAILIDGMCIDCAEAQLNPKSEKFRGMIKNILNALDEEAKQRKEPEEKQCAFKDLGYK